MDNTTVIRDDEKPIPRNVSMYGRNWAVVDEISRRFDLGGVSPALRYIISEYVRLSGEEVGQRLQPIADPA